MVTASPQPAAGQRLQGLPRRRLADRAAGRRRDRRRDRRGRPARRRPAQRRLGDPRRARSSTPTSTGSPAWSTPARPATCTVVYTPLHGVGRDVVLAAFDRAGFPAPTVVAEQAEPDPDFPHGRVPQPRGAGRHRPGAAPRPSSTTPTWCSPTTRTPTAAPWRSPTRRPPAGWRMLRGDEVGALLGAHLVRRDPALSGAFAASIVSSSLLGRIAAAHGPAATTRRSPASSGSPGSRACATATRRRSATASTRTASATRTASRPRCSSPSWPPTLKARGPHAHRPARRPGPRARPARHRPALGPGRGPRADRGRDGAAARRSRRRSLGGRAVEQAEDLAAGHATPAADRRAALPAGRRRPGGRAALRHRAEAQGLPRGRGRRWSTTTSPLPGVRPTRRWPRSRPTWPSVLALG